MRLLVDTPSLLWQSLLTGKDEEFGKEVEHEGKKVWVNGWQFGYECAMSHLLLVIRELAITPSDIIFVVAGEHAKARRKAIYSGYKEGRESRPPDAYVEFNKCKDLLIPTFRNVGSQVAIQSGVEEDDILAYLARNLDGDIVILTRDGDMTTLINDRVSLWQNGTLTKRNKYGPFPCDKVAVFKALCGDGNEYKGASGFGPKSFLDFLVWAGDGGLAAIEGMMKRRTLHELEEDVAEFKPLRKVIDSAEHVYQSYECALLHDEWVNTKRNPMTVLLGEVTGPVTDSRLERWAIEPAHQPDWVDVIFPPVQNVIKNHAVFDCELIGTENPVFLVCFRVVETNERGSFWWHKDGDMAALEATLQRPDLTWISFNGIHFDAPLISAAIAGKEPKLLKMMAQSLIEEDAKSWNMPSQYGYDPIEFDHIDLYEVAPGVRISLKTYAGRLGYPTMVDMPFHHDKDLSDDELPVLESYCQNDLGVTQWLFQKLRSEIDLRVEMSVEHGIDLRSKSDAQVAEAVLKKAASIKGKSIVPPFVEYKVPSFIKSDSPVINDLIAKLESTQFRINQMNGRVIAPEYLEEPIKVGWREYQCGVGGIHSVTDKRLFLEATEGMRISDFDVASYYPNVMLKAGLTPRVEGGDRFIKAYEDIYTRRMDAKRDGNKKIANALKIQLNGTFGKLGSMYSAFYAPDLMLAVTLTGQLNLMCLIWDLEKIQSVCVMSANTDGIMVIYPPKRRQEVLDVIAANVARTGFEYEETPYNRVAMKDVNNYLAITSGDEAAVVSTEGISFSGGKAGKAKRKGLYASNNPAENPLFLMKNPTNEVCSIMVVDYLRDNVSPLEAIEKYDRIEEFVSIRDVKGGGIQYENFIEVDDWELVLDLGTKDNEWRRPGWEDGRVLKRKSRPKPVQVGVGGTPFGRVARWYMSTTSQTPINYVGSGNKVPKTEGARLCMTLPDTLPADLDKAWYVRETVSMLSDMGVEIDVPGITLEEPVLVTEESNA